MLAPHLAGGWCARSARKARVRSGSWQGQTFGTDRTSAHPSNAAVRVAALHGPPRLERDNEAASANRTVPAAQAGQYYTAPPLRVVRPPSGGFPRPRSSPSPAGQRRPRAARLTAMLEEQRCGVAHKKCFQGKIPLGHRGLVWRADSQPSTLRRRPRRCLGLAYPDARGLGGGWGACRTSVGGWRAGRFGGASPS